MRNKIKALLIEIGFHHSWGVWISNTNSRNRIVVNKQSLSVTKKPNFYLSTNEIKFNENSDIEKIKADILNFYNSGDIEISKHIEIIDGVINAKNSNDLKVLLDKLNGFKWQDNTRMMFLLGLLQGALMQYKKEVCIEELNSIFKK